MPDPYLFVRKEFLFGQLFGVTLSLWRSYFYARIHREPEHLCIHSKSKQIEKYTKNWFRKSIA